MKNIAEILKAAGVELTEEQLTTVNKEVAENYKTVADYDKQTGKLEKEQDKVKTLTESLDKFKDVDVDKIDELQSTVEDLNQKLKDKDAEYAAKEAAAAFDSLVDKAIQKSKGKNAKAIIANLDIDSLKESKNQEKDIEAALDALAKGEDTSFLFETDDPGQSNRFSPIGRVGQPKAPDNYLDEKYKDNPYYSK